MTILQCLLGCMKQASQVAFVKQTCSSLRPHTGQANGRCSVNIIYRKESLKKGVLFTSLSVLYHHGPGLLMVTVVEDLNNRNSFSQNGSPEIQTKLLQNQTPFKSPRTGSFFASSSFWWLLWPHLKFSFQQQLDSFPCLLCLSLTRCFLVSYKRTLCI